MNLNWFLRMSRWARRPPSMRQVLMVLAILAICAAIVALERLGLLPDWMAAERIRAPALR
jgi:hypothetical protein